MTHEERPHYRYSPSASTRWLTCPGSLQYESDDKSSAYAAEGTAAHELAEKCLLLGVPAYEFLGEKIGDFEVSEEMVNAVQIFIDEIPSEDDPEAKVFIERRLEHSKYSEFGGTLDTLVIDNKGTRVVDFKYGSGVVVEVEENTQLSCYALLALDYLFPGEDPSISVDLVVVQPRAPHPDGPVRTWTASSEYLKEFRDRVVERIDGYETELVPGDHCRWCPGKADCPKLHEISIEIAREEFSDDRITPEKAAEVLRLRKALSAYVDAVEKWSHGRLDKGIAIPGYKLIKSFGNRRFTVSDDELVRKCKSRKIGKKQLYEAKLISPAKLEKLAGKEFVSALSERPHKGTTVVPESDKREAVERMSASEEFDPLNGKS